MLLECETVDRQNAAARVAASGTLVALATSVFPGCALSSHGWPGLSITLRTGGLFSRHVDECRADLGAQASAR